MEPMETVPKLELCASLDGRHGQIWSLSWSPNPCNGANYMLASCGDNVIVWHCDHSSVWRFVQLHRGKRGPLKACAWRFDGKVLAAGGCDSKIVLWEYKEEHGSFECINEISVPHEEIITSLSWSKERLLCCTKNGCISIVDLNKSGDYDVKWRGTALEIAGVFCAEWHPDGMQFALGGYKIIKVYRPEMPSDDTKINNILESDSLATHDGEINCISFWIDGSVMVSSGTDGMLQFVTTNPLGIDKGANVKHKGVMCCDWSRCYDNSIGYLIASGSHQNGIMMSVQYTLELNNSIRYRIVTENIDAHDGPVTSIKWHHKDPRLVASTGLDGPIKIWRVTGSVPYRTLDPISTTHPGRRPHAPSSHYTSKEPATSKSRRV